MLCDNTITARVRSLIAFILNVATPPEGTGLRFATSKTPFQLLVHIGVKYNHAKSELKHENESLNKGIKLILTVKTLYLGPACCSTFLTREGRCLRSGSHALSPRGVPRQACLAWRLPWLVQSVATDELIAPRFPAGRLARPPHTGPDTHSS